MAPSRSVQRRSLPYPFIHEFVRSTTQRLPTWMAQGTPLREISGVEAELGEQLPGGTVVLGDVQVRGDLVGHRPNLGRRGNQGWPQQRRVVPVGPGGDQAQQNTVGLGGRRAREGTVCVGPPATDRPSPPHGAVVIHPSTDTSSNSRPMIRS